MIVLQEMDRLEERGVSNQMIMDWKEIMIWYPIDGEILLVRGVVEWGSLDMSDITCPNW